MVDKTPIQQQGLSNQTAWIQILFITYKLNDLEKVSVPSLLRKVYQGAYED